MDFLPTLARLAGGEPPGDRIIDGKDIRTLLFGKPEAASPHETFYYYLLNQLEAVRMGKWKLHMRRGEDELKELYDLEADIGETANQYDGHPDIVREIEALAHRCREDIGDSALGIEGANRRPCGRVENPDTLTHYDPEHPYIVALYDITDGG
jgi:arylsulfatase A-like enzyme